MDSDEVEVTSAEYPWAAARGSSEFRSILEARREELIEPTVALDSTSPSRRREFLALINEISKLPGGATGLDVSPPWAIDTHEFDNDTTPLKSAGNVDEEASGRRTWSRPQSRKVFRQLVLNDVESGTAESCATISACPVGIASEEMTSDNDAADSAAATDIAPPTPQRRQWEVPSTLDDAEANNTAALVLPINGLARRENAALVASEVKARRRDETETRKQLVELSDAAHAETIRAKQAEDEQKRKMSLVKKQADAELRRLRAEEESERLIDEVNQDLQVRKNLQAHRLEEEARYIEMPN